MTHWRANAATLGLTAKEVRVLEALDTPLLVSDIARKTRVIRTSLYSILHKLKRRKFVETLKCGRRLQWRSIAAEQVARLFERMRDEVADRTKVENSCSMRGVVLHHGKAQLIELYDSLLLLEKGERILYLQPNQSTELVVHGLPLENLLRINQHIRMNRIIVEAILHENAIDHFIETMSRVHSIEAARRMTAEVADRVAATTYIPRELLRVKSELIIFRKVALILNWADEEAVEIRNEEMVEMLSQMFKLTGLSGVRVDQNPKIGDVVHRLGRQSARKSRA